MKETTGELNMTIVTIVAVSAIGALLWFVVWPMVQKMITDTTCKTYGDDYFAVKIPAGNGGEEAQVGQGNAKMNKYGCCKGTTAAGSTEPVAPTAWNDQTCIKPDN